MLDDRLTEQPNPRSEAIDRLSTREIVRVINQEDATVAEAVEREAEAIARVVDLVVAAFRSGGRLIYVGAGTSGRTGRARRGRDAAHLRDRSGDGAGRHRGGL